MTQPDALETVVARHALERRLQAVLHELAASRAEIAGLRRELAAEAEKQAALSDRLTAVQQQATANTIVLTGGPAAREALEVVRITQPPIPLARLRQVMRQVPGWSIARAIVRYRRQSR